MYVNAKTYANEKKLEKVWNECYQQSCAMLKKISSTEKYFKPYAQTWVSMYEANWRVYEIKETTANRRIGCCHCTKRPAEYIKQDNMHYDIQITISSNLLKEGKEEHLYNTMMHELFHAISSQLKPKDTGHKGMWKFLSEYYNTSFKDPSAMPITRCYDPNSLYSVEEVKSMKEASSGYRYELYCPKCGQSWSYKTKCDKIKNPERYYCKACSKGTNYQHLKSRAKW